MRYWHIETLGDEEDPERLILDAPPQDIGVEYWRLCKGQPCTPLMPEPVHMLMSKNQNGLRLTPVLSNTQSFLLVHRDVKMVIEAHYVGDIEFFPFDVIDPRGRIYARDYFIVNPIGVVDGLDHELSEIEYFKQTEKVISIDRLVLDADKLHNVPCLFRLKEEPDEYLISDVLAQAFDAQGLSMVLDPVEVRSSGQSE